MRPTDSKSEFMLSWSITKNHVSLDGTSLYKYFLTRFITENTPVSPCFGGQMGDKIWPTDWVGGGKYDDQVDPDKI